MNVFIPNFVDWANSFLRNAYRSIESITGTGPGLTFNEYIAWFRNGYNEIDIRLSESLIMMNQYIEQIREFIITYLNHSTSVAEEWFLSMEDAYHRFWSAQRQFYGFNWITRRRVVDIIRMVRRIPHSRAWLMRTLHRVSSQRVQHVMYLISSVRVHLVNLRDILRNIFKS